VTAKSGRGFVTDRQTDRQTVTAESGRGGTGDQAASPPACYRVGQAPVTAVMANTSTINKSVTDRRLRPLESYF